jgi:hypothetical protein
LGSAIRGKQDFLAGLLFVSFGLAAVIIGRDYPFGTSMRMGPGYFPTILGWLLTALGLVLVVRGMLLRDEPLGRIALAPTLFVLGAVALFALTVERLGIVVSVALVVLVSALPSGHFRWHEVLGLAVVMIALAVGLFTYGLGLPFKILPG